MRIGVYSSDAEKLCNPYILPQYRKNEMLSRPFHFALLLFLLVAPGCASMNRTQQIAGIPLPSDRMKNIRMLGECAYLVPPDRQELYASSLSDIIHQETDALIRREAVLAIANYRGPTTIKALEFAAEDADKDVRLAVCRAWMKYNAEESVPAVIGILASETDLDIRLEAIEILGRMGDRQAVPAMVIPLSSTDPALHHYTVLALQNITGYSGTDPKQWLAYCQGEIEKPQERVAWFGN